LEKFCRGTNTEKNMEREERSEKLIGAGEILIKGRRPSLRKKRISIRKKEGSRLGKLLGIKS